MSDEYSDNPAGRLWFLLLHLHQRYPNPEAKKARLDAVLPALLNVPPNTPDFFAALGAFYTLPAQVRTAVNALDEDDDEKEHLLSHLDEIEAAFSGPGVALANQVGVFVQAFAPGGDIPRSAAVANLRTCSRVLHRSTLASGTISDDDLAALTAEVTKLMDEVHTARLDGDITLFLLSHLQDMLNALNLYRVSGRDALENATWATMGAMQARPGLLARLGGASVWAKFAGVLTTLTTMFGLVQHMQQIKQTVAGIIENPPL